MTTKEAYEKLKADEKLSKSFVENPIKVLSDLGVDLKKTRIAEVDKSDIPEDGLLKGCWSVGEVVCYSWD